MKKVLVSLFAITLTLGAFAQDSTNTTSSATQKPAMQKHEGVIVKDGKLLMMKNGQTTLLTSDLTLDNGAIVMTNGTLKGRDGTTTMLKEGDYVGLDGTTGNIKNKWQDKDKTKTDSAR